MSVAMIFRHTPTWDDLTFDLETQTDLRLNMYPVKYFNSHNVDPTKYIYEAVDSSTPRSGQKRLKPSNIWLLCAVRMCSITIRSITWPCSHQRYLLPPARLDCHEDITPRWTRCFRNHFCHNATPCCPSSTPFFFGIFPKTHLLEFNMLWVVLKESPYCCIMGSNYDSGELGPLKISLSKIPM